ncbi:cellulose biosynthesis protein BcsO [Dickeya poaceiphila]|uniref:Cellulose biosynthesis protein BcsO n=1 Tax=Dickeya poaceiphila TaxID=568768 RepID=A0A5B8I0E4_9GAMM|nr:cellulose biosynthesis protein BcsO [Dickeya poaceiphila]QDX28478.1 cellulose biosynthesis protein BcsO [Dickeya poaceiphila]
MNSYDDMQRFKDKAQIKDINFRDMSGQVLQSDTVVWPIIKQLLRNQAGEDSLSAAQPVSIAQPVPASLDALSEPVVSPSHRVMPSAAVISGSSGDNRYSLFNAIAASPPPVQVAPVPVSVAQQVAPQREETISSETPRPHPLAHTPAPAASTPVMSEAPLASEAGRFRQLFSRHRHDETHSVSKTMLLKPLLEKIALCR